jgi:hypothetical protein
MRKDQRHLVLSLALAGTVLASAAAPVVASTLAVQTDASAVVAADGSAMYKFAPQTASASAFLKI